MNKTEKLKTYSDGRLFIEYPSHMKFKCYKKGGAYTLKVDRNFLIGITLFPKECMDDLIQQTMDCRTYDGGMTKITYLREMIFGDNTGIARVVVNHKMDGTFIEKRYCFLVTSVKSYCLDIQVSGLKEEFDIKDFSEILGSIRVTE